MHAMPCILSTTLTTPTHCQRLLLTSEPGTHESDDVTGLVIVDVHTPNVTQNSRNC